MKKSATPYDVLFIVICLLMIADVGKAGDWSLWVIVLPYALQGFIELGCAYLKGLLGRSNKECTPIAKDE